MEIIKIGNTVNVRCPLLATGRTIDDSTEELCLGYLRCPHFRDGKCNIATVSTVKRSKPTRPLGCQLNNDPYWENRPNGVCRVTGCPYFGKICQISKQPIGRDAFPTDMVAVAAPPKPSIFKP